MCCSKIKKKTKPKLWKVAHFQSAIHKAISVITHYTQVFFMSENVISKTTVKKEDKTNITNYMTIYVFITLHKVIHCRLSQNLHINNIFLLDNKGLGRGCRQKTRPPHSQIIFFPTLILEITLQKLSVIWLRLFTAQIIKSSSKITFLWHSKSRYNWFWPYLKDWNQREKIKSSNNILNLFSHWVEIKYGVPMG